MAVLSGATASGRQFYAGSLATTSATLYTAPSNSANVTSPSATAYVKEIIVCNTTSSTINVIVQISGTSLLYNTPVAGNDSKVISGINTMMNAGNVITASASATGLAIFISGVEVQ